MKPYLYPTFCFLVFICAGQWGYAQITSAYKLPAMVAAKHCTTIAQFGPVFIFRQEEVYFKSSIWRFNASTGQFQQWSTPGVRAGEVQIGADGLWWFEEELDGRGKIQYGAAAAPQVQTLHRFEGSNNTFIGVVKNGAVAKAGSQIIHLQANGVVRTIESWGESRFLRPFSWQNRVLWYDPQQKALLSFDGTSDRAIKLGHFSMVDAHLGLGSHLLFQTKEGWYRSDGTPDGTQLFFNPPNLNFYWTNTLLGDSIFLFSSFDLQSRKISLWRSNGTTNGTFPIKTFSEEGIYGLPDYFVINNGKTHFIHWAKDFERVIWQSDGTAVGTLPVESLPLNTLRQIVQGKILPSGQYAMMIETLDGNVEPALFDGNFSTYDLRPGGGSALSRNNLFFHPVELAGRVFLAANDGKTGLELWRIAAGQTQRMGDLAKGAAWSFPCVLGVWKEHLYWIAGENEAQAQVYQSAINATFEPNNPISSVDWFQSIEPPLSPSSTSYSAYMGGMFKSPKGLIYVTGAAQNLRGQGIHLTHGTRPNADINTRGDHFLVQLDASGRPRWSQQLPGYTPLSSNGQVHLAAAPDEGVYWAGLAWGSGQIGGKTIVSPGLHHWLLACQ